MAFMMLFGPAKVDDGYKVGMGPMAVHSGSFTLHDDARNKDIPVRISFPETRERVPLIVWSHGLAGSKDGYRPLVDYWVSWGYVCIQPSHADSVADGPNGAKVLLNPRGQFKGWQDRAKDIQFALDSLEKIQGMFPGAKFDSGDVGMGGHSFGAQTTELIWGTQGRIGSGLSDPRPKACLMISPSGLSALFSRNAWDQCTRPGMIVSGSNDLAMNTTVLERRKDAYNFAPPGDKYLVWIDGAYHGMGGIAGVPFPGSGPVDDTMKSWVQMTTLAYWDKYLKNDSAASAWLASKDIESHSLGKVSLSEK